jgi:hypothetical protein
MSEFEERVRLWRQSFREALGERPEVIDELEGHLREDVEQLVRSGHSLERAWETARARLGAPTQLAGEFAKLRPTWLPARLAYGVLAAGGVFLAGFLMLGLARGRFGPLLAVHVFTVTIGYGAALAVGGLAVCAIIARAGAARDVTRDGAVRHATRRLATMSFVLTAVGVALGAVWAREHMGRYWGWDLKEVGGLSVLCWGVLLALCAYTLERWSLAVLLLAVAGNVVVGLSWFGPGLVAMQQTQGTTPWAYALVLGAFLLAQLLVGLLALLPPGRLNPRRTGLR